MLPTTTVSRTFDHPGDNMYQSMEADLQQVMNTHNALTAVVAHKTDSNQMAKYKELYLQ